MYMYVRVCLSFCVYMYVLVHCPAVPIYKLRVTTFGHRKFVYRTTFIECVLYL